MRSDELKVRLPEEIELDEKRRVLGELEDTLAERELELATLQIELRTLQRRFDAMCGSKLAEIDTLKAQLASRNAQRVPRSGIFQEAARLAEEKARRTKEPLEARGGGATSSQDAGENAFDPPEKLRALYRALAKRVHPDLALSEEERVRRTRLMAEANQAYKRGDEAALESLLTEWIASPEAVQGNGLGVELVKVIRAIAQGQRRLAKIAEELVELKATELFQLLSQVREAAAAGEDLMASMKQGLASEIDYLRDRLRTGKEVSP